MGRQSGRTQGRKSIRARGASGLAPHQELDELRRLLGNEVDIANEEQVETLFIDCEPGAVPALGAAYGLKVIVDDSFAQQPDIYFEGGDHTNLVHVSGGELSEVDGGCSTWDSPDSFEAACLVLFAILADTSPSMLLAGASDSAMRALPSRSAAFVSVSVEDDDQSGARLLQLRAGPQAGEAALWSRRSDGWRYHIRCLCSL